MLRHLLNTGDMAKDQNTMKQQYFGV